MAGHIAKTGRPSLSRVRPLPVSRKRTGAEGLTGHCQSCPFQVALLEALSMLQSLQAEDGPSDQVQPIYNTGNQHHSLRRSSRATAPKNTYVEESEEDVGTDTGSTGDGGGDKDNDKTTKGPGRRAPWTELEESRLRAWKIENQSEEWIAGQLGQIGRAHV